MIGCDSDLPALLEAARAAEREGRLDAALTRYEQAFQALPRCGDAAMAADLLRWIGSVHRVRRDFDLAEEAYEASLAVAEAAGLVQRVAPVLNCFGALEQYRGRIDASAAHYERARTLAARAGDERLAAMIDQNLGILANIRGDVRGALRNYRSASDRLRNLGDETTVGYTLTNAGMAHVDLEEWDDAERCFDEAYAIADRLHDADLIGSVELNRAELYLKRGDLVRARACCDRAYEILGRIGAHNLLGEVHKQYGAVHLALGHPMLAGSHLERAVALAVQASDPLLEAEASSEWALVYLSEKRNREALGRLNRAHTLFSELGARREILDLDTRLDRLEETYLRVVQDWGESIEEKDRYTAGHCRRVADYACALAAELGYAGRPLTWFRMGAFLHDVGKISVPAEVLNKPDALSPDEWELMKNHTVVGDEIVTDLDFPADVREMVRSHHERWDGSGYPDGLAGASIPLSARILCIADVFDALTTARSYRPALPHEEALRIMTRDAGRLLDAELLVIFIGVLDTLQRPAERRLRVVA